MIALLDYGAGNVRSVQKALTAAGGDVQLVPNPDTVAQADAVVLPGVGAFGAGMQRLQEKGLVECLQARIQADRPTLAICLGLQLLCKDSAETPDVEGLSCIPASVGRFSDTVTVPQLGWNMLDAENGCKFLSSGYVYYANSYRIATAPKGWNTATSQYDGTFCGALERGAILACQFHPELSGALGSEILDRWLQQERATC